MMFDIPPITSPHPKDCGATCLKMLLAYYGIDVPLEQLVKECKTDFFGSSAKNIKNAGIAHGLDMAAWKSDAEGVLSSDRPTIIWWLFDHFVVYGGLDDDGKVVIYNPDKGRYRVSRGTFASFYTGVALSNGMPEDLPEASA